MKRYFKIFGVAFLAGVGAARVLIWLNMGIVHLLVMRGGCCKPLGGTPAQLKTEIPR